MGWLQGAFSGTESAVCQEAPELHSAADQPQERKVAVRTELSVLHSSVLKERILPEVNKKYQKAAAKATTLARTDTVTAEW